MAQTSHDTFAVIPRLDAPMIDPESGVVSSVWYRLFLDFFKKLGGSETQVTSFVFVTESGGGGVATNAATGQPVNLVAGSVSEGAPPETKIATVSPFEYTALVSGLITINGGQVELRRGASAYATVGLVGGAIRLLPGDNVKVSWFSTVPPAPIVWYPDV